MDTGLSRASLLRRGAIGGGAFLVSASGFSALAGVAKADAPPASDLTYLRLLIGVELLALDFQSQALASGKLGHVASPVLRRMRADEKAHYTALANAMVAAGQTPATAGDINFSYPKGSFSNRASVLGLAERIERLMLGAYLGAIEDVQTATLRLPIGQIAASEAQHRSALAQLTGRSSIEQPFPSRVRIDVVSNVLDEFES